MKVFGLVLVAMLFIVGCGDRTTKEAGTDTTAAHTPAPTGGAPTGQNDHSAMSGGTMMSGDLEKDMSMMNEMMVKTLGQQDLHYDHRFIDMMIPHHEAAITMAGDALGKATHPEIKKLGQDIIDAQKTEIAQMEQWRKQWYGH